MKPRSFAAAWTLFTVLAAPAALSAADDPESQPPALDPALTQPAAPAPEPAAPPEPALPPEPAPTPAPAPAAPAQDGAAQGEAGAGDEAESRPAAPKPKAKPVARAAASATVSIKDFDFSPKSVTINVGDTVTWTNAGPTVHTATGSGFDTGNLSKGASGSHTFTSAGTFAYICTPHPFMKASVSVVAASSGDETGSGTDAESGVEATAESADGPSLADTGSESWVLALIGAGLLSLGAVVRRRAGSP